MAYQKILVAVDRSNYSDSVFEAALTLAKQDRAALMVLHCLSIEEQDEAIYRSDSFDANLADFSVRYVQMIQECIDREQEKLETWLKAYCDRATAGELNCEWRCEMGGAGRSIRNMAGNWGADLVVLGRRGRKGLTEVLLGSVSNYVMHHAPCSVLVVQGVDAAA